MHRSQLEQAEAQSLRALRIARVSGKQRKRRKSLLPSSLCDLLHLSFFSIPQSTRLLPAPPEATGSCAVPQRERLIFFFCPSALFFPLWQSIPKSHHHQKNDPAQERQLCQGKSVVERKQCPRAGKGHCAPIQQNEGKEHSQRTGVGRQANTTRHVSYGSTWETEKDTGPPSRRCSHVTDTKTHPTEGIRDTPAVRSQAPVSKPSLCTRSFYFNRFNLCKGALTYFKF